ncbi:MAG: Flp pilus assembly complex ATPase component TadA [Pseudomonadales bacterium]|nr:Flp pilus assembly complex ATPase component TadA [Pseudomonadales bacterium]
MSSQQTSNSTQGTVQPKKRLGEQLVEMGLVTADQVSIAITEQKKSGGPLGKVMVRLGFVTDAILRDALGAVLGKDSIDLTNAVPDEEALKMVSRDIATRFTVIPVNYDPSSHQLQLAMSDVYNLVTIDRIRAVVSSNLEIVPILASESEIMTAIDQFYGYELSVDGILKEIETGEVDYASLEAGGDEYSQPLVRLVDAMLADAVKRGASDLHFEPEEGFLRLRYRIDGVLRQIRSLHKDYWSAIVVRLKVLSGMNIAETRAPQDGRISLKVRGRPVDFRVSSQPTTHGENFVLRVLDRTKGIVPIEDLDLYEENLQTLKIMMARPEGIILVTGPTGSGKTTMLYSMINYRKSIDVNIMTLEDPVEYPMDLIRQTDVNQVARMDFASGIRSLLRQDPDIILVGEVRDEDTAEMAFRAAMTGHQVFTTLHTNSALGAIPRLLDIGVMPDIMAGNIIGIVGQRLIRKLCQKCKKKRNAEEIELFLLGLKATEEIQIFDAIGCSHCDNTGYKGRISVIEVLKVDNYMDDLIADKANLSKLKMAAKKNGFRTLADDGIRRIKIGETSLDELSRVVDLTENLH